MQIDFQSQICELTRGFVGRQWLLGEIDRFLATPAETSSLLITGEPGIGKSAVAACLVQQGRVHAHHFCQGRDAATLDPIAFAASLSGQLCRALPDFGRHVAEQEPFRVTVHLDIGAMTGSTVYAVYIDRFIVETRSAEEAFEVLVRSPLASWAEERRGEPVLLLVDALDEAVRLDRRPNILDLIATARGLPRTVRWLLTSRPGEHLGALAAARLAIPGDSADSTADARAFVDLLLATPALSRALAGRPAAGPALAEALVRRSEGNFLYLRYVGDWLRDEAAAGRPLTEPGHLPQGLAGVYRWSMDRLLARGTADDLRRSYRPVLGILAVAREALGFEQLCAMSGVERERVSDALSDLSQFLEPGLEDRFAIYHTSFADFLTDRRANPALWVDPVVHHGRIADLYLRRHPPDRQRDGWAGCDDYGLRFLAAHLAAAGRRRDLLSLLAGGPAWMEAKARRPAGRRAYLEDLDLAAAGFADPLTPEGALELTGITAARHVAGTRAGVYTDAVLETLALLGRSAEALAEARGRGSPEGRFDGLLTIERAAGRKSGGNAGLTELVRAAAEIAAPARRREAFRSCFQTADPRAAMAVAREIPPAGARTEALAELARLLAAGNQPGWQELYREAIAVARQIGDGGEQATVLATVAAGLAAWNREAATGAFGAALAAAGGLADPGRRGETLSDLTAALAETGDDRAGPALRTAWEAAVTLPAGRRRNDLAWKISKLAQETGSLDLAAAAAGALDDDALQAEALRQAARALSAAERYDEAAGAALAIRSVIQRARALSDLSLELTRLGLFTEALAVACRIDTAAFEKEGEQKAEDHWHPNASFEPPPEWGRDEALDALVQALAEAGRLSEARGAIEAYGDPWRRDRALAVLAETPAKAPEAPPRSAPQAEAQPPASAEIPSAPTPPVQAPPVEIPTSEALDAALAAARKTEDGTERSHRLLDVARDLARAGDPRAATALEEGLQAARASRDDEGRTRALAAVAQALTERGRCDEARTVVGRIASDSVRAKALIDILRRLAAADHLAAALELAGGLAEPKAALGELRPLLRRWIGAGRSEEAVKTARSCKNRALRTATLSVLAAELAAAGLVAAARQVAASLPNQALRAEAESHLIRQAIRSGRLDEALAATRGLAPEGARAPLLTEIAAARDHAGDESAPQLFEEALAAGRKIRDPRARGAALLSLAQALEEAGDASAAEEPWEEARAAGLQIKDDPTRASFLAELALAMKQADRWEADEVLEEAGDAAAGRDRDLAKRLDFLIGLAQDLEYDDPGEARDLFDEVLSTAARNYDGWDDAEELLAFIEKVLEAGDPGEIFESAIAAAKQIPDEYQCTEALIQIAMALSRQGLFELAENAVMEIEDDMDQSFARDQIERVIVEMRVDRGDYDAAWGIADEITSDEPREAARRYLAERLGKRGSLEEARTVADRFAPGELRATALAQVAKALARAGRWDDALATTAEIAHRESRDDALRSLAEALVQARQLGRALSLLPFPELETFLATLARWSGAFEEIQPGLALAALAEATRIAGWAGEEWREIHLLLRPLRPTVDPPAGPSQRL